MGINILDLCMEQGLRIHNLLDMPVINIAKDIALRDLTIIIDLKAEEIIRLVASVHPSVCPSVRQSVSQRSQTYRVFISRGVQNGCASNQLLFRQVAPSRSTMLLIIGGGMGRK